MKINKVDAIIVALLVLIIAAGVMVPMLSRAGSRRGGTQGGTQSPASDTSGISYKDYNGREKTREFIRQLKTLRLEIPSSQINYSGIVEQFKNYCTEIMEDTATGRNMMLTFERLASAFL